jgi:DNA end-binding protein Ku
MKSVWKGVISFGLVSIPVRLYLATEERGVALHQVHVTDGGRIRYRRFCTVDGEEVPFEDIVRGYELPTGEVVVLTAEDFANLPLSTSRAIDVMSFVDAASLDPVQLARSYFCEPADSDPKPYVLLRDALERTGKVAIVKVALRQRESLAALRPRNGMLVLQLMLWPDEVREPRFPSLEDDVWLRPQELQMASAYVEAMTGEVELEQLVEAKVAGRMVEQPPAPVQEAGVDLMEALRRSVEEAKRARGDTPAAARRATTKRTTKRTATRGARTSAERAASARTADRPRAGKTASAKTAETSTRGGRTPGRTTATKKQGAQKATAKKASTRRSN